MTHRLIYNNESHTYFLNGKRCKSGSTVAKMVSDSYSLDQWRKRQIAVGFTLEPRLRERAAVDLENKDALDAICEDAMKIAGSHHAADRGTQRHRASELLDTGGTLITEQQEEDAQAWRRTLEAYEIDILPEYVEGFAIWPEYGVAGRFDRIVRYKGRHVILDLKSGINAVKYPQSTAAQLAIYARAPFISRTISTAGDRSTVEDWASPPADLDLETGYVIVLGDGMDVGDLYRVDIGYGWLGAELALNMVNWRKGRDYGKELAQKVWQEKKVKEGPDLFGLISLAGDRESLTNLWKDYKDRWTKEHTAAAEKRILELEAMNRLKRMHQ